MAKKKRPSHKAVESVLRPEGSLWWERFEEKVGLEPGVKERGSYGRWEWWVERVRRSGKSMNRQVRDRGTGMRLTEITRKLIPQTWWGIPEGFVWVCLRTCRLRHGGLVVSALDLRCWFPAAAASTGMGHRLRASKPPQYFTKPPRPT